MSATSPAVVRRRDPLAAAAFWLAIIIMICPLEADLLAIPALQHRYAYAILIAMIRFAIVFTPFLLAWRRIRREPSKWSGMGYLNATGIVLILNPLIVFWLLTRP